MLLNEIYPDRLNIMWQDRKAEQTDLFLCYGKGTILAGEREGELCFPTVEEAAKEFSLEPEKLRYLFRTEEHVFYTDPGLSARPFGIYEEKTLRWLRTAKPKSFAYPGALGLQLYLWYRRSRFCGRCGRETVHSEKERMMYCPDCGNMIYPQICPSVIIGILHEGRMLLTKYNPAHIMVNSGTTHTPAATYSLVAGYVESGETAEEAVKREAMEEVGLQVENIRYYRSQPWPFSSSLLLGFFCDVKGSDRVTLEEAELSVAEWKTPEEMPDRSMEVSLTSDMMEAFRLGRIPGQDQ